MPPHYLYIFVLRTNCCVSIRFSYASVEYTSALNIVADFPMPIGHSTLDSDLNISTLTRSSVFELVNPRTSAPNSSGSVSVYSSLSDYTVGWIVIDYIWHDI